MAGLVPLYALPGDTSDSRRRIVEKDRRVSGALLREAVMDWVRHPAVVRDDTYLAFLPPTLSLLEPQILLTLLDWSSTFSYIIYHYN
jgi:hypothetical protein